MTRKHYMAIADKLNAELSTHCDNAAAWFAVRDVALSLADTFAQDNPAKFDRERFYNAVGIDATTKIA